MPHLPSLFSELIRFETELWDAVDARLRAEFDLPLSRFEPMQVIARYERCQVNTIAKELVITIGGTSKIVDRIEVSGYCRRRPNPDDQRSSLIELTPEGQRILAQATEVFEAELERRLGAVLSARSLAQFRASLRKLRAAGQQLNQTDRKKALDN